MLGIRSQVSAARTRTCCSLPYQEIPTTEGRVPAAPDKAAHIQQIAPSLRSCALGLMPDSAVDSTEPVAAHC